MLESILYDVKPRELLHLIKYMNIFCCCQSFPKWKEYIFYDILSQFSTPAFPIFALNIATYQKN